MSAKLKIKGHDEDHSQDPLLFNSLSGYIFQSVCQVVEQKERLLPILKVRSQVPFSILLSTS